MKTTANVSISKYLLAGMLSLLLAPALRGDSWMLPGVVTVSSPSSNYIAQVIPGSGEFFGGYQRAITNRERNACATISVCPERGITNVVWSGKLINPVAPVEVYVSNAGYLVTMDNWHQVGYGAVIAIYDPKGRLMRHWPLEELFKPEEQQRLTHSVSSIWWHAGQANFAGGTETNTFVVPAVGKTFRFALTDGTLLAPSAIPANAELDGAANRSQPVHAQTNQTPAAAVSGR